MKISTDHQEFAFINSVQLEVFVIQGLLAKDLWLEIKGLKFNPQLIQN